MLELVVARYKENIDWISNVDKDIKITIYNKYEGDNLLPNVGRESHTHLFHMTNNYENLADFTLFVQGNPLEHCSKFFEILSDIKSNSKKYEYVGISDGLITCDGNGRPHCGKEHLPLAKLYEFLFKKTSPDVFICNSAGQFGVSKNIILKNSKDFYKKALTTVSYSSNPIEGFCFERMWASLFGFSNQLNRNNIDYSGDINFTPESYFAECYSTLGFFNSLGALGFKDQK
jgi:hypothetical protein